MLVPYAVERSSDSPTGVERNAYSPLRKSGSRSDTRDVLGNDRAFRHVRGTLNPAEQSAIVHLATAREQ